MFRGVDESVISSLLKCAAAQMRQYAKQESVFAARSAVRHVFVSVNVLASESLVDWLDAVETELTVDSEGRIAFPAFASAPQMFFKLQAGLK